MSESRNFSPFGNTAIAFPGLNTRLLAGWLRSYHPLAKAVDMDRVVFIEFHPDQAAVCGLTLCTSRHIPRSIAVPFHAQFLRHLIAFSLCVVNGANHRHVFYIRDIPLIFQRTAVGRTGIGKQSDPTAADIASNPAFPPQSQASPGLPPRLR